MENTTNLRAQTEIDNLKANWSNDPCWDIEDTEGFEAHREELIAYSEACQAYWNEAYEKQQNERRAKQRGRWGADLPDKALDYIDNLETRLSRLEDKVSMIKPSALYTE